MSEVMNVGVMNVGQSMKICSDPESPALLECALSCDNLLCDVLGRPPSTRFYDDHDHLRHDHIHDHHRDHSHQLSFRCSWMTVLIMIIMVFILKNHHIKLDTHYRLLISVRNSHGGEWHNYGATEVVEVQF